MAVQAEQGNEDRTASVDVLVIDDYDLFRTGLVSLLKAEPRLRVVGQASSGRAGVRLAEELSPDVVLMDLQMPDISGHEATQAILARCPETRVVVLTVMSDDEDVQTAIGAGASGYLAKDRPINEVVAAIQAAAAGNAWLSPRAAEVVLGRARRAGRDPVPDHGSLDQLSTRELEVLQLIARGLENSEIAEALQISPRTVKNHVSSVLAKLGLPSRVQAAIFAIRQGAD